MAIRPILHGPLADDVSGRIAIGYLYITPLDPIDPDGFYGAEPGPLLALIQTNLDTGSGHVSVVPFISGSDSLPGGEPGAGSRIIASPERLASKISTGYFAYFGVLDTQTAESTLTLSHTVEVIKAIPRELTDTLTLTDEAVYEETPLDEISKQDTLGLTEDLVMNLVKEFLIEHSLSLSHEVLTGEQISSTEDDTLTLSHILNLQGLYSRSLIDTLTFTHEAIATLRSPTRDTYTATDIWVCPDGVTSVTVECWGGGGGGGGSQGYGISAGGGGGGAYSKKTITVTPGVSYTTTVGAAGTAGTGGGGSAVPGGDGGDSWFSTSTEILAKGGRGGQIGWDDDGISMYGSGGQGGLLSAGIGSTRFSGGAGGAGSAGTGKGGGGGAGAGTSTNGPSASGATPGTGIAGGGSGGSHAAGTAPAGGGAGANGTSGETTGFAGAAGKIVVSYTLPIEEGVDQTITLSHSLVAQTVYDRQLAQTLDDLVDEVELDTTGKFDALAIDHEVVVEVIRSFEISHSITFTDELIPGAKVVFDDSHTIGVSDEMVMQGEFIREPVDSLTLSHDLVMNIIKVISFSDSIGISDTDESRNLAQQNLYQETPLVQTAVSRLLPKINITQSLGFSQSTYQLPYINYPADTLSFSHVVTQNLTNTLIIDSLELSQTLVVNFEREFELSDSLAFTHASARTEFLSVSDDLELSHDLNLKDEIISVLAFTDLVTVEVAKHPQHTITLTGIVQMNFEMVKTVSQSLTLSQGVTWSKNEFDTCHYNPISSVLPSAPTLTKSPTITYTCGLSSLTLKAPAVEDSQDIKYKRIVRETIGGTLQNYRQSTWPKTKILNYTFNNLDCDSLSGIQTFLKASLGLEVTLLDYWGRTWVGVITNPNTAYTEASRTTETLTLSFQGSLQ